MSVQEIQSQISRLSAEEQLQVEAFLKTRRLANSSEFRARVDAAHRRMDAGESVSADQLRAMLKPMLPAAGQ
jgi:hypothetical protein